MPAHLLGVNLAAELDTNRVPRKREPLIPPVRVTRGERNRLILVLVAAGFLIWLLWQSWNALGPFIFALVLAYLMSPLVDRFSRVMPRSLAILLVYFVFLIAIGGLVWWLAPVVGGQIRELADQSPIYQKRFQEWVTSTTAWYQALPLSDDVRTSIENAARTAAGSLLGVLQRALTGALLLVTRTTGFLVGFVIIPFWLFYVLKDSERGIGAFNSMIPRGWREDVWRIVRITNGIFSKYIRGQLLLALVVGVATTIGMLIVGAPYAVILGIISGFTEVIPVIGPVLGAVPGVVLALFTGDWLLVAKVLAVYIIVQQLENNLLVPKIQGDSVNLHPAVIMVALVIGSQVAGLFGLIIAVPVAAILRDVYLYLYRRFTEDFTPPEAEASVPSRSDEESPAGREREARELAEARRRAGINTEDELIADLDETTYPQEHAEVQSTGGKE